MADIESTISKAPKLSSDANLPNSTTPPPIASPAVPPAPASTSYSPGQRSTIKRKETERRQSLRANVANPPPRR
jgi:hypothetical protein